MSHTHTSSLYQFFFIYNTSALKSSCYEWKVSIELSISLDEGPRCVDSIHTQVRSSVGLVDHLLMNYPKILCSPKCFGFLMNFLLIHLIIIKLMKPVECNSVEYVLARDIVLFLIYGDLRNANRIVLVIS